MHAAFRRVNQAESILRSRQEDLRREREKLQGLQSDHALRQQAEVACVLPPLLGELLSCDMAQERLRLRLLEQEQVSAAARSSTLAARMALATVQVHLEAMDSRTSRLQTANDRLIAKASQIISIAGIGATRLSTGI